MAARRKQADGDEQTAKSESNQRISPYTRRQPCVLVLRIKIKSEAISNPAASGKLFKWEAVTDLPPVGAAIADIGNANHHDGRAALISVLADAINNACGLLETHNEGTPDCGQQQTKNTCSDAEPSNASAYGGTMCHAT